MLFVTIYKNCSGAAFGRRIGNQVQILGEPVTVNEGLIIGSIARQRVRRDDPAMLHKPGDLPGQKKAASGVRRADFGVRYCALPERKISAPVFFVIRCRFCGGNIGFFSRHFSI